MNKVPQHRPVQDASSVWLTSGSKLNLSELIEWCQCYGVSYSDRDNFICARPWTVGAGMWDECKDADTWFIFVAAGNGLKRFFDLAPFPLPKVAFWRQKGGSETFKVYSYDRLKHKIYGKRL